MGTAHIAKAYMVEAPGNSLTFQVSPFILFIHIAKAYNTHTEIQIDRCIRSQP